jgi:hypothetical protein
MITLFVACGFPMWIVTALAVACLVTAGRFAVRGEPRHLAVVRALTWALVFSVLSGVVSNFLAVMWKVPRHPDWSKEPLFPVMQGLGEAVVPAILGFTALSVAWILVAVGVRRAAGDL